MSVAPGAETADSAATPTPLPAYAEVWGRVESGSYPSAILGREMPYLIYLPPTYDTSDRAYPVLYLLHGYPYDEHHWEQLGVFRWADNGIRSGAYPPFIIVLPNGDPSPEGIFANTSGGDWSVEGLIVNELIPYIERTYRALGQREGRAIGGISRGGVWSLEIGFHRTDLFATVGGHSPALSVNYPHPVYDPFNLVAANPDIATLRIWLDAGNEDWAWVGAQHLHELLDEKGIVHQYFVGEGSHADDYWARMIPTYLAFYTGGWAGQ
jgi:enterochelin esterase-like enzyme